MSVVIIFDWDGTLYASSGLLDAAIRHVRQAMSLALPERSAARSGLTGRADTDALEVALATVPVADREVFRRRVAIDFVLRERHAQLLPGARSMLENLRQSGLLLGIATGRERRRFCSDLQKLRLTDMFAATVCGDEAEPKPSPNMLLHVCRTLDVDPQSCLFVGDSPIDQGAAGAAGMPFIAVSFDGAPGSSGGFDESTVVATSAPALTSLIHDWVGVCGPSRIVEGDRR